MGEIKSTLDLVLEKTKHLSLTSEERQLQQQNEIKKRIGGLLQKYQNKLVSGEQLQVAYEKSIGFLWPLLNIGKPSVFHGLKILPNLR